MNALYPLQIHPLENIIFLVHINIMVIVYFCYLISLSFAIVCTSRMCQKADVLYTFFGYYLNVLGFSVLVVKILSTNSLRHISLKLQIHLMLDTGIFFVKSSFYLPTSSF